MTPDQYMEAALRTEFTPQLWVERPTVGVMTKQLFNARLLHSAIGLCTESGELQDWIKKDLIYGKPLDRARVVEELGDQAWYLNLGISAIGSTWQEVWAVNINKLRVRFPDKFTQEAALNRDTDKEYTDALARSGNVTLSDYNEVKDQRDEAREENKRLQELNDTLRFQLDELNQRIDRVRQTVTY